MLSKDERTKSQVLESKRPLETATSCASTTRNLEGLDALELDVEIKIYSSEILDLPNDKTAPLQVQFLAIYRTLDFLKPSYTLIEAVTIVATMAVSMTHVSN